MIITINMRGNCDQTICWMIQKNWPLEITIFWEGVVRRRTKQSMQTFNKGESVQLEAEFFLPLKLFYWSSSVKRGSEKVIHLPVSYFPTHLVSLKSSILGIPRLKLANQGLTIIDSGKGKLEEFLYVTIKFIWLPPSPLSQFSIVPLFYSVGEEWSPSSPQKNRAIPKNPHNPLPSQ